MTPAWDWLRRGWTPADLRYDLHAHLLPCVDDGARSMAEALAGIGLLAGAGYRGAVVTPHIYPEAFDNTEDALIERFAALAAEARARFAEFGLQLAAEYLLDEPLLHRVYHEPAELLYFGPDHKYLMVEFPLTVLPPQLDPFLDRCASSDLRPVVAHPERYGYVQGDGALSIARSWREQGALLQVNVGSVAGQFGRPIQGAARRLWRAGLVDLVGTDLHRPDLESPWLARGWRWLARSAGRFSPSLQRALLPGPDGHG